MIFEQILDRQLGCASYLLGCPDSGQLLVIDPLEAVGAQEYLLRAADMGLQISHVVDTHLHADHVSAGRELAELCAVPYMLHADATVAFDFTPLHEGDVLTIGAHRLEVMHTPGHTDESIALLVYDAQRSRDVPWFVLSGDSLFVGDVARPDLAVDVLPPDVLEERSRVLRRSVLRLAQLPEFVELYPGHYGASTCGGAGMSAKAASTIGFERRFNTALRAPDDVRFREIVRDGMKPTPFRYQEIKRRNMGMALDQDDDRRE